MTTEEIEASQSGVEDVGVGGPGAPTPLTALEVRVEIAYSSGVSNKYCVGRCRSYEKRYSAHN